MNVVSAAGHRRSARYPLVLLGLFTLAFIALGIAPATRE